MPLTVVSVAGDSTRRETSAGRGAVLGDVSAVDASRPEKLAEMLTALRREVRDLRQALDSMPMASGVLRRGVALALGPNDVSHGLGRAWQGWCLVSPQAAGMTAYAVSVDAAADARLIRITVAAAGTADIWVW